MTFVRPEARAALARWREPVLAAVLGLGGLWLMARGGLFYFLLGAGVVFAAAAIGVAAWRRSRFARPRLDPGVVQVVEGQVAYFGPETGGVAALADLTRVTLETDAAGRQTWHLMQAEGAPLAIPAAARGTEALHDAFATLPGFDLGRARAALDRPRTGAQTLWQARTDRLLRGP